MRALAARVVILKFLSKRKVTFLFILLYPLLISSTAISNAFADSYNWDVSPSSGYQAGDGTWGVDNYWSKDGTTLETWPGEGNNAEFVSIR